MGRMIEENIYVTDIYREIYESEGLTQREVAEILGMSGQSGVASMMHKGIKITQLYKLMKAIGGYRLVVEKVSEKGRVQKRYIIGE